MKAKIIIFLCTVCATVVGGTAFAAQKHSANDSTFAAKAAQGGLAEVKLGELAVSSSSNPNIQNFAKQMVKDHSEANDKFKALAQKDGVTLPTDVSPSQSDMYVSFEKLNGRKFERKYAQAMLDDHKTTIALFEKEANSGRNPDFKHFAQETLPTLKAHLQMAKDLCASVGIKK